ncbi:MAG: 3'-5' exonuclease [Deltaproteobacteria bacterium]|nr:3'-5' exonuclease [Deltaproteobacteria bacterium]
MTTGLSAAAERVVELGLAVVEGTRVVATFETLVNPERAIPPRLTDIHGITTAMASKAPTMREVLPALLHHLDGAVFTAHNAQFDHGFLEHEVRRVHGTRAGLPVDALCTKLWAWHLYGRGNGSGEAVEARLGIRNRCPHHALPDVEATVEVLLRFLGKGGVTVENLAKARALRVLGPMGSGKRPAAAWEPGRLAACVRGHG